MSGFRIVVGIRTDRPTVEYYLGYQASDGGGGRFDNVRSMLAAHAAELEAQAAATRCVLSSDDPELAERFLQDGVRLQVSEVILRPQPADASALDALFDQGFVREAG